MERRERMGFRSRKAVLREIQKLAGSRANDAVRLAFMSGEAGVYER